MSFKIRTDASGNGQFTVDSTDVLSINTNTTVSLPTGTANGVAYLNGSKVLTSGSALTFDGTNLRTGGITFADASTQSTGGYTGFRNRIINGAMMIDQRNAGASVSPSGSSVFCTDRWRIQAPAGTAQRISSTLSAFAYSLKYTASDSNAYMQMGQQIEFLNCSDMQNQTVTISFRAKANNSNSGSTALTVRTRTGATVDGSVIFAGTNADTSVTITTSDAAYSVTRTLPATFGALSVEFVLGSHVSGDGLEITGIQLEKGSVATPFEFRPYGTELALCQRYFQLAGAACSGSTDNSATTLQITEKLSVPMRTAPTGSIAAGGYVSVRINGADVNNGVPALANFNAITNTAFWTQVTGFAGQPVNAVVTGRNTTAGNNFISLSAEL